MNHECPDIINSWQRPGDLTIEVKALSCMKSMSKYPIRRECTTSNWILRNEGGNLKAAKVAKFSANLVFNNYKSRPWRCTPKLSLRIGKLHPLPKNNKVPTRRDFSHLYFIIFVWKLVENICSINVNTTYPMFSFPAVI
jgi:hypothetical protein